MMADVAGTRRLTSYSCELSAIRARATFPRFTTRCRLSPMHGSMAAWLHGMYVTFRERIGFDVFGRQPSFYFVHV